MFKLTDNPKYGTSLQSYIKCSYVQLEKLFGTPQHSDEYKVSSEWIFHDEEGNEATLYDYKETNLYDQDLPTVEEFRKLPSFEWHVGAANSETANKFIAWLLEELRKGK